MAVIEYDEYKQKLQALEPTLGELEKALGIPKDRQELKDLQAETEQDGTAVCILARSDGTALLAGTGTASLFLP